VAIGAVGNIKMTFDALLPRIRQHEDGSFLTIHVERFHRDRASAKAETVSGPDSAISGTYLTKIISRHAAEDALFAADDGTATVWMLRHRHRWQTPNFCQPAARHHGERDPMGAGIAEVSARPPGDLSGRRRRVTMLLGELLTTV
jgi:pyruvate dehydrogenase (quinone)